MPTPFHRYPSLPTGTPEGANLNLRNAPGGNGSCRISNVAGILALQGYRIWTYPWPQPKSMFPQAHSVDIQE